MQCAVDLLCDERHKRMKQLQSFGQNAVLRSTVQRVSPLVGLAVQTRFYHLDVPVAELLPQEIVNLLYGNAELVAVHIVRHLTDQRIYLRKDPFICQCQAHPGFSDGLCFFQVHHDETGRVPYFVGEVPAGLHALHVETHVVAGRVSGDQRQTERVRAVFVDDFERIDTVSEGFTHLASLGITNESVDQYVVEAEPVLVCSSAENTIRITQKKDDVITGYEYVSGIEVFKLLCLLRPAKSGEGPQRGGEPGIQGILVLVKWCSRISGIFRHSGLQP